jgi:hypothetical protein
LNVGGRSTLSTLTTTWLDQVASTFAQSGSRFAEALQQARWALAAEGQGNCTESKRLWRIEPSDEFPA